jgi:SulP family sulfate permease
VAMAALLGTLVFGVLSGVLIGVGLSIFWLISVATRPHIPVLAREPGTSAFRELREHPDDGQVPGVVVLRMDGGLFFATSDALEDRVREIVNGTPGLTGIVLDCGGMDFVDSQGSATLGDIITLTEDAGVVLRLARVKPGFKALLDRDHVLERLGPDRIHGNIVQALQAHLDVPEGLPDGSRGESSTGP